MNFVVCDLFIGWLGLPLYLLICLITFTLSLYYHLVIKPKVELQRLERDIAEQQFRLFGWEVNHGPQNKRGKIG